MEESGRHQAMKDRVSEVLESDGWEVSQEVPMPPGVKYHRHDYLADVFAEKEGTQIVVEVGQLRGRTVEDIQQHVDRAYHIEYLNTMPVGVEYDLHRVLSTAVQVGADSSIKRTVSNAVLDSLRSMDNQCVGIALQKYGYDSVDELESVVDGDILPKVAKDHVDGRMSEIVDS